MPSNNTKDAQSDPAERRRAQTQTRLYAQQLQAISQRVVET